MTIIRRAVVFLITIAFREPTAIVAIYNSSRDNLSLPFRKDVHRNVRQGNISCTEYCSDHGRPAIEVSGSDFRALILNCNSGSGECPSELLGVPLNCWNVSSVTNMRRAFEGQWDFDEPIGCWDVSNVEDMHGMFWSAIYFNQPLNEWDVSNVKHMKFMFRSAYAFNQPLNEWDLSSVETTHGMFLSTLDGFNQPLNEWDVSNVEDMESMFHSAYVFNQPLDEWDVSNVKHMGYTFANSAFNQPLNEWDVSNVDDMHGMFSWANVFNQPLDEWDVSNVKRMDNMFRTISVFNQPLSEWNVSSVGKMDAMFWSATSFNQPLNEWDVSQVKHMELMFSETYSFNQPLSEWNMTSVKSMREMFYHATSFNQPLDEWDVSSVKDMKAMFKDAAAFNQCLATWGSETVDDVNIESIFIGSGCQNTFPGPSEAWCQSSEQSCFAPPPSIVPTSAPKPPLDPCRNKSGPIYKGLTCSDVGSIKQKKKRIYCKKKSVKKACPGLCNQRCTCTDNLRYKLEAYICIFKCKFAGNDDQPDCLMNVNHNVLVQDVCPRKCNYCYK